MSLIACKDCECRKFFANFIDYNKEKYQLFKNDLLLNVISDGL